MTWAARLIEEHFDERFYLQGEVSTVRRWLDLLPPELAGSRARLLLARARLALLDGGPAEAEGLLDLAERASADADEGFEPSAGRASSLLVNVPAAVTLLRVYLAELRGDAETTVDLVPRAMAARREGEAMLGTIIGWYAGMAEWLRGRPAEAERLLSPAVGQRSAAGEGFLAAWVIEAGALRTLALAASGQEADAVTALAGLLSLAGPRGYVRVFADEGPPMAALLGQLVAAQRTGQREGRIPIGYLARLNRAFDTATAKSESDPRRGSAPTAPGIVEPLTNRELEVLQMLAAGQSNQAIASQLVVTLDTVKKHVSHLLGKLGAANRTEAVARARELDLIS